MLLENEILGIVSKYKNQRQNILYILKEIQNNDENKEIKEEYCKVISKEMNVSLAEIYEIITFYSMLSNKKQGKHIIEVCTSGPCYVSKSKFIVDYLKEKLGVEIGETTLDKNFTLRSSSCIGACDISPVIKIGEKLYGNLTKEKVDKIIEELRI